MDNNHLKQRIRRIVRETIEQLDLFDGSFNQKIKKPRRKMSDREKEERKAERELQKKIKAEKDFEDYWAQRGWHQGYLFSDDDNQK